jgi:uncharacterized lipoprotein YddW (UPF0748 family)
MVLLSLLLFCTLEVRGIWIPRWSIDDHQNIFATLDGRFNHVFLQVFALGEAYYPSRIVPSRRRDDTWLREFLMEAHARNIKVSAWINVFYSWGYAPRSRDQRHPINLHPNWYVQDRVGNSILSIGIDALRRRGIEGYYLAPASRQVRSYVYDVIDELMDNYEFDGIHLDYCRYPSRDFIYDVTLRSEYMREYCIDPVDLIEPEYEYRYGTWGQADLQRHWQQFARDDLTQFIEELSARMNAKSPSPALSIAVKADYRAAGRDYHQAWPQWVNLNLVDFVCLMAYSNNIEHILTEAAAAVDDPGKVAVGLGVYRLSPARIRAQVKSVAAGPFCGVVFFSYEELRKNTVFLDALD